MATNLVDLLSLSEALIQPRSGPDKLDDLGSRALTLDCFLSLLDVQNVSVPVHLHLPMQLALPVKACEVSR